MDKHDALTLLYTRHRRCQDETRPASGTKRYDLARAAVSEPDLRQVLVRYADLPGRRPLDEQGPIREYLEREHQVGPGHPCHMELELDPSEVGAWLERNPARVHMVATAPLVDTELSRILSSRARIQEPLTQRVYFRRRPDVGYAMHHPYGPARTIYDGAGRAIEQKFMDEQGRLHREDGPAHLALDGSRYWYVEGKLVATQAAPTFEDPSMAIDVNGALFTPEEDPDE